MFPTEPIRSYINLSFAKKIDETAKAYAQEVTQIQTRQSPNSGMYFQAVMEAGVRTHKAKVDAWIEIVRAACHEADRPVDDEIRNYMLGEIHSMCETGKRQVAQSLSLQIKQSQMNQAPGFEQSLIEQAGREVPRIESEIKREFKLEELKQRIRKRAEVKSWVETNPPAVAPTRERVPVRQTIAPDPGTKRWDVFISHASEDKEEIAHDLANALRERGFEVWYDAFSLKLGDSLRESIDRGLSESRFGVVILSKHFFSKHWPNKELNGLAAIEVGGEEVILPVWHGVDHSDVVEFSPTLADRKAISTKEGLDRVVAAIEEVIRPPLSEDLHEQLRAAEQDLQEYRCSYCGSPLVQRSSVSLSEHDDGTLEEFACGYTTIEGFMQRPCPSDPKFPRLEDYDFVYRELTSDPIWKVECFAKAKTKEAEKLFFSRGFGRTKEEACQNIVDQYNMNAKPWKRR